MTSATDVANKAAEKIEQFLRKHSSTIEVENVEAIDKFRKLDIDLLWKYKKDENILLKKVEIKGDRYYHTGNYFFETISNESKQTPGCFLYTAADYVFYYFVDVHELHILPVKQVRRWFMQRINTFRETRTSTPVGNEMYVTVGRLVPREQLIEAIKTIRIIRLLSD